MSTEYNLEKDDEFFLATLDSLLKDHLLEFAVIHDAQIASFFKTREEAMAYGMAHFNYGEYLVSQVINQEDAPKYISYRYAFI